MRIISGKFKGHRFHPPANKWPTRPTTDISKEGLFNILQNQIDFESVTMLDLFGGTGNHCFEFISRGCRNAIYVDKHKPAVEFVRKQAALWHVSEFIQIVQDDIRRFLERNKEEKYDYIFAGPPYGLKWLDEIPNLIFDYNLLKSNGLFVLEHNPNHDFESHPHFVQYRKYGQTRFSFFK